MSLMANGVEIEAAAMEQGSDAEAGVVAVVKAVYS